MATFAERLMDLPAEQRGAIAAQECDFFLTDLRKKHVVWRFPDDSAIVKNSATNEWCLAAPVSVNEQGVVVDEDNKPVTKH